MTTRRLLAELRATPRSIGDIAEACNVSRREVEKACEELAATGYPLVAGPRGVRRAIREWSGQLSLFGEAA